MARARLLSKPALPLGPRAAPSSTSLSASAVLGRSFQIDLSRPRWIAIVALLGLLTAVLLVGTWFAWNRLGLDLAVFLWLATLFSATQAWAVAVYGLRAQHLGYVLRADEQGVHAAALGRVIPWRSIGAVRADQDLWSRRVLLMIDLYPDDDDPPSEPGSWMTWLTGRSMAGHVVNGRVHLRLSCVTTTPQDAAASICRVGPWHGWQAGVRKVRRATD